MFATVLTTALIAAASVVNDPFVPAPLGHDMIAIERNIIKRTNEERARHGLPMLAVDLGLISTSREHCAWMANSSRMQHTRRAVGENIAMGQASSHHAVECWMNSSGHRANILSRNYTRIGAAAYLSPNGRIYFCQQFLR